MSLEEMQSKMRELEQEARQKVADGQTISELLIQIASLRADFISMVGISGLTCSICGKYDAKALRYHLDQMHQNNFFRTPPPENALCRDCQHAVRAAVKEV